MTGLQHILPIREHQSEYLLSQSNFQHIKITMLQSKVEWQKKSALLINLLNLEHKIKLVSADTSLMHLPFSTSLPDAKGFEKRPEYLGMNATLKSYETQLKTINQGLLLPKLKVGFDNGAFGTYTAAHYDTYQLNASLLWTLPLGRLTYKGDVKKYAAQINLQENEIAQFKNEYQQEISTATAQIQIAWEQMTIGKQALQSSFAAMSQSIDRQNLGTARAFEVFQSQQFLLQAQFDYLKAVSEYNKAQFGLKVAMGDNL